MRSRYHFARSGSRSSAPRCERPHHRGLGEVLGVGVVAAERPGVAEDLGAVLDHDLAEVDDASSRLVARSLASSAPSVPALARSPPGRSSARQRTFRSARLATGLRCPTPWPASRHPAAARRRARPARRRRPRARAARRTTSRCTAARAARRRSPRSTRSCASSPTASTPRCCGRALPRLRVVANVAVGYDNIDVAAAAELGIAVCNTPGVLDETTADLAFLLILAAARRASDAEADLRARPLDRASASTTSSASTCTARTLGVVGFGRIGQAVARRAAGFGMEVLHHTRHDTGITGWVADLDDLLRARRRRVAARAAHDETRGLIDARRLALMKPTAVLVNTARGPVVDEEALAVALEDGTIFAAGIDVYEREPEVHPRLLAAPHTVLLPHIGSATKRPAGAWPSSRARGWSRCSPASITAEPRVRPVTSVDGTMSCRVAEGEGFEPSRRLNTPYSLSRRALSAAQSSLRVAHEASVRGRQRVPSDVDGSRRSARSHRHAARTRARRSLQGGGVPQGRRRGPRPLRSTSCASSPSRAASSRSARDRVEHRPGDRAGARRRGARVPRPARGGGRARRRARRADIHAALAGDLHLHSDWSDGGATDRADGAQGRRARARLPRAHRPLAAAHRRARARPPSGCASSSRSSRALNEELAPFRILTGIEVDILDDGSPRPGRRPARRARRRRRERALEAAHDASSR